MILSLLVKVITVSGMAFKDWIISTLIIRVESFNRVTFIIWTPNHSYASYLCSENLRLGCLADDSAQHPA